MGRRGVQQLTPAQWREALEQQIREKQQSEDREGKLPRRSQSAPQQPEAHQGEGGLAPSVSEAQRAATTSAEMEGNSVAGSRRRFQLQLREEYLKELQAQIEEKRNLAQEAQETEQSRHRRRMSRSEDDAVAAQREDCREEEGERVDNTEKDMPSPELQESSAGVKETVSTNQEEPCQAPSMGAGVAADPVAITKIVDFCEELKKQNEDVKRQLLEQHAVLASLHSTLAVEVGGAPGAASQRRHSSLRGSVDHSLLKNGKVRAGDARTASSTKKAPPQAPEAKLAVVLPIAPRPRPMRGETRIPLPRKRLPSSLRSAGAHIIKGLSPGNAPQETPLKKAEVKSDACERLESTKMESKATAPDPPRQHSVKEEHPQTKELDSSSSSSRGCGKLRDANVTVVESKEKKEERSTNRSRMVHETKACDEESSATLDAGDECPMNTESKLVHVWELAPADDELLECTSTSVLDDRSAFISLDRPLSNLFR